MILPWVNFKAVKEAVSVEMAIAYYGVMLHRIPGSYLRGRCPLPTHASTSSNQSFIVNTEKNVWACHSASCVASRSGRSGGNVLDFVAAMERCSLRDAALKLQDRFAVTSTPSPRTSMVPAGSARSFAPLVAAGSNSATGFYIAGPRPASSLSRRTRRGLELRHPFRHRLLCWKRLYGRPNCHPHSQRVMWFVAWRTREGAPAMANPSIGSPRVFASRTCSSIYIAPLTTVGRLWWSRGSLIASRCIRPVFHVLWPSWVHPSRNARRIFSRNTFEKSS